MTLSSFLVLSQQIPDSTFNPNIQHPEHAFGKGPVVSIDEGHNNFHTKNGRYNPLARLLERDGYIVKSYKGDHSVRNDSTGFAKADLIVLKLMVKNAMSNVMSPATAYIHHCTSIL